MSRSRSLGANAPRSCSAAEDDLTQFVRTIARQAAREAFKALLEAQGSSGPGRAWSDPPIQPEVGTAGTTSDAGQPAGSDGQFHSVAAVAKKLDVSEKTVRRKIEKGELSAVRVGKLLRVSEQGLAGYLAREHLARLSTSNNE